MLGLAVAALALRAAPALAPGDVARLDGVGIDGVTLAFTLGVSIAAGLLFGTAPALQRSRIDPARTLNEGHSHPGGGLRLLRSNRTGAVLVVAQVALAVVLLTGAGLLLRSFVRLITVDRGYDPAHVVAASVRNPEFAFPAGHDPRGDGRAPGGQPPLPGSAAGRRHAVDRALRRRSRRGVVTPAARVLRREPGRVPRGRRTARGRPAGTSREPWSTSSAPATST